MTVSRLNCDKCGDIIERERSLLHVQCGPLRQHHPAIDLCPGCAADFVAWLASGPDATPPAKLPAPAPRPAPVVRPHAPHAVPAPILV